MEDATLRLATPADMDRVFEIVHAVPGEESVALMGNEKLAQEYDRGFGRLPIPNESRITMVAEVNGRVLGLLQYRFGDAGHRSRVDVLKLLVRVLGPVGFVRRLPALWSRTTVDIDVPKDSFHITHLHVDEAARGQNLGTKLLRWGEAEALRLGAKTMSLTTLPTNVDAVRFYERHGFKITKTVSSRSYAKHTGIPGRLLLQKDLPSGNAPDAEPSRS